MLFADLLNSIVATGGSTPASVNWGSLITSTSFDGIIGGINDVLPVVIPVGITIIGIGIVWRMVKKMIKSK